MSLINQMLQELEARRSEVNGGESFVQQIRAVPERRRVHPAWWVALSLGIVLSGLLTWLMLRPAAPAPVQEPRAQLPLKLEASMADAIAALPDQPQQAMQETPVSPVPQAVAEPRLPEPDPQVPSATTSTPVAVQVSAPAPVASPTSVSIVSAKGASASLTPETTKAQVATPSGATPVEAVQKQTEPVSASVVINKQVKELTPQQRAENEYRKAINMVQQGRSQDAIAGLEQALQLDPHHAAARQALISVLIGAKRQEEAVRHARHGLELDAAQPGLAMILARLQVDRGELRPAIETLEQTLSHASDRADYHAFLAALLQRDERHRQAVEHYAAALQRTPQNGVWWMGLGISLQAENRSKEALDAFRRARGTNSLSPELQAFVDTRIGQLQQ